MGVFELGNSCSCGENVGGAEDVSDLRRLREECIIALKVYDSCRQQDCLTNNEIGPSRAAASCTLGDQAITEGEIIDPPDNAASVTIDNLRVKKVIVGKKEPNPFRNGFWDTTLKYVFVYNLTFREADGQIIGCIKANSIYTKKITLFGSIGTDIVLSTDLFKGASDSFTMDSDPFILVEAKAVALSAELNFVNCCSCNSDAAVSEPKEVFVTIGLFTIIKLFRIVNLTVQSKGFCIPEECQDISSLNPCDYFENLDFPMDIFAPPQRPEFIAGVSNNISNGNSSNNGNNSCGCGCGCRS